MTVSEPQEIRFENEGWPSPRCIKDVSVRLIPARAIVCRLVRLAANRPRSDGTTRHTMALGGRALARLRIRRLGVRVPSSALGDVARHRHIEIYGAPPGLAKCQPLLGSGRELLRRRSASSVVGATSTNRPEGRTRSTMDTLSSEPSRRGEIVCSRGIHAYHGRSETDGRSAMHTRPPFPGRHSRCDGRRRDDGRRDTR